MHKNIVILLILPLAIILDYQSGGEKLNGRKHTLPTEFNQGETSPEVKIEQPDGSRSFQWGSRVRYEIRVSDEQDGDSRYGEINPNEVLLEITYLPGKKDQLEKNKADISGSKEHKGLSIIRKSACFSCHADKTSLTGPSFSDIADRYTPDADILERLGKRIINGSTGQWGNFGMPPNEELTLEESVAIADYILKQGSRKDRRIYSGLEGVFQIIDKPENDEQGMYILTASYISHGTEGVPGTGLRGEHSVVLEIESREP
jgi:cytochrome c